MLVPKVELCERKDDYDGSYLRIRKVNDILRVQVHKGHTLHDCNMDMKVPMQDDVAVKLPYGISLYYKGDMQSRLGDMPSTAQLNRYNLSEANDMDAFATNLINIGKKLKAKAMTAKTNAEEKEKREAMREKRKAKKDKKGSAKRAKAQ